MLAKSVHSRTLNVMPGQTTGGTDVIREKEMDDTGERGIEGDGREGERRGRERKRDEMRQGYRDERKTSLSLHFFNILSS